jgi:hypothetical protein
MISRSLRILQQCNPNISGKLVSSYGQRCAVSGQPKCVRVEEFCVQVIAQSKWARCSFHSVLFGRSGIIQVLSRGFKQYVAYNNTEEKNSSSNFDCSPLWRLRLKTCHANSRIFCSSLKPIHQVADIPLNPFGQTNTAFIFW